MTDKTWTKKVNQIKQHISLGELSKASARIIEIHQAGRALPRDVLRLLPSGFDFWSA